MILVDTAIVMPFAVWMIKGFVDGIPLKDAVTLPVGLQLFNGQEGMQWRLLSAARLLIMAPMIVQAWLVQKHFAQGMTTTMTGPAVAVSAVRLYLVVR